jgi:hypothetical protein
MNAKKIQGIIILFVTAIVLGYLVIPLFINSNDEPKKNQSTYLEAISSFPKENDEVYIGNIAKTLTDDKYVYLLEHRGSYILKFDLQGNFMGKIGKPGRGPGELINPIDFSVVDNKLYTLEQGKMQVQEFDVDGNYIDTYFFHGAYMELLKSGDKVILKNYYYSGMPEFTDMPESVNFPLFTVLNLSTDSAYALGRYPSFFEELDINHSGSYSTLYNEKVYTVYKGFPLVQVHDLENGLVNEIYLKGGIFTDVIENYLRNPLDTYPAYFLDIKVNEHGIFLCSYGEHLFVYQFDFDGNLEKRFEIGKTDDTDRYIRNFDIILSKGKRDKNKLYATVHGLNPRTLIADFD